MLKNYFITAIRNLWRNKFFSLINILGLSVGIACCMLIFLYAKDETSFDRFHENQDNIYRLTADLIGKDVSKCGSTGMMPGPAFKSNLPEVADFVRIQSAFYNIKNGPQILEEDAIYADDNFFSVFSFPLIYGNPKTALSNLHSVVISESTAKKYFGKTDVMGQVMEINVSEKWVPFVVSGVAKDSPQNSSIKLSMVLPMKFTQSLYDDKFWANFFLNTFIVLKPGVNVAQTELKINRVYLTEALEQIKKDEAKYGPQDKVIYRLQPLSQMHLNTEYNGGNGLIEGSNPMYSYILCGIAMFILIIACINFVNLTVARSLKRAKEIGIRKVVGSHKKQLVFQFMGESFILSFFSFSLAIVLTSLSLPFFNSMAGKALSFSYLLDSKLITGYVLLFFVTGFLAGFYPALVLSGFNPVETLYGRFRFTGKNYLSKGLIVFQFTLATFLIIATITIYSQFSFLINYDLGINTDNVVRTKTPPIDEAHFEIFKRELKKDPSILQVTGEQGGTWGTMAHINGNKEQNFNYRLIDENFFSLFKIPVVQGRNFIKASSDSTESVLVNETFVKEAGWKNPIGEIVDFFYRNEKFRVVGVIKDYHFDALTETIKPQLFTISKRHRYGNIFIKVAEGSKGRAIHHIEKTYKSLYTMQPTNYVWLKEDKDSQYNREAKWKQIITFSTFLTVFISCIGLFGLAALSAEKRAKEIGIRKVLGASVTTIVQKLSADFLKLVFLAGLIASPLAWWVMNKWLQDYPYRIEMKTTIFGFAIVTVVLVSLLTVLFQSLKAAVANPVKSLRSE